MVIIPKGIHHIYTLPFKKDIGEIFDYNLDIIQVLALDYSIKRAKQILDSY